MISLLRLSLLSFLLFTTSAHAVYLPSPPKLDATGYLLIDYQSGQALAEQNADTRLEPASLTKILSTYLIYKELAEGRIAESDQVTISEKAWRMPGSRMFVEVGSKVTVGKLLKGIVIQSGNDATVAMAEHIAGTEEGFAELMNYEAKRLGMNNSHFVNSTGLPDPGHYTTPRDLATVTTALIRDFPDHYPLYKEKKFVYNNIPQYNRNKLLWQDDSVDGVKTGHTESAGFCLVASAMRNDMRLISIVMGTDSENARARESQKLLDYGFRFYETHLLYPAAQALKTLRIWKGNEDYVQLGLANDLFVTVPRGSYGKLQASLSVEKTLVAPAHNGHPLGMVNISLEGEPLTQRPLIALNDVAEGNLFSRLLDSVLMLLE